MYFVAKSGKITGPLDATQFEQLRTSGELEKYTWYWEPAHFEWVAIDPAPSAPVSVSTSQAKKSHSFKSSSFQKDISHIEVICHDYKSMAAGTLRGLTEHYCEVVIPMGQGHFSPQFAEKSPIILNLLDTEKNQAISVTGSITSVSSENKKFIYRIRWNQAPEIVQSA